MSRLATSLLCATALMACSGGGATDANLQPAGGWDFDVNSVLDSGVNELPDGGSTAADVPPPVGPSCTKSSACKDHEATPYCALQHGICVQCLIPLHCQDTTNWCEGFKCVAVSCKPAATRCEGDFLQTCNATGDGWQTTICPDDKPICLGTACALCKGGQDFCAQPTAFGQPSRTAMKCSADGQSAAVVQQCQGEQVCVNGKCRVCTPGQKRCSELVAEVCNPEGNAWQVAADCAVNNLSCIGGLCLSPCSDDIKSNTNVGCDYWAVDLDNIYSVGANGKINDAQNAQFSVIVSNTTAAVASVHVTLAGSKDTPNALTEEFKVSPKALRVIDLPRPAWGKVKHNQEGSSLNYLAYRIQSDQPIVAYQFNPLSNVGVFSNDASLLLPASALGKEYLITSRKQLSDEFRSYATVVATIPGETQVTVKVTTKTLTGPQVASLSAGQSGVFTLKQGQVLNIESAVDDGDLTGTLVTASQPVAVFGGSECSYSGAFGNCLSAASLGIGGSRCAGDPSMSCTKDSDCEANCCCDHLEEQMFPLAALGKQYVGARLYPRGKEKDTWRLLAANDGTTVKITPNIGVTVPTLNKGKFFEFVTDKDFVMDASGPILVAQYMASSFASVTALGGTCEVDSDCLKLHGYMGRCQTYVGSPEKYCEPIGDPSMMLDVATSQFLDDYVFLVPDKYATNYISVIVSKGTIVQVDGQFQVPSWFETIPGTNWQVARLPIQPGAHHLKADKPVGLFVYGYDDDVSYGYPGGAGLGQ